MNSQIPNRRPTVARTVASWFSASENPRFLFFGWALVLFLFSLVVAFWGAASSFRALQTLNDGKPPDLATMGELFGGTLGVAVAFAGAWVAFDITTRANKTLGSQQQRDAWRLMHGTLDKSIGEILTIQLAFERLLRESGVLARLVDHERMEDKVKAERIHPARTLVKDAAGQLSEKIRGLLKNPLGLSVLFDLQKAKDPEKDHEAAAVDLLQDLSQFPRLLDHTQDTIRDEQRCTRPHERRWDSFYDWVLRFTPEQRAEMDIADFLYGEDLRTVKALSYLCHLTGEYEKAPDTQLREPAFWRVLRYFVYTRAQAEDALQEILPETVYEDPEIRSSLLGSELVRAFCISGEINDSLVAQGLRDCERITNRLKEAANHHLASRKTWMATLVDLDVIGWGRKFAVQNALRLLDGWPVSASASAAAKRRACKVLYEKFLCGHFANLLAPEWETVPAFEIYRRIFSCYRHVRRDQSIMRLFGVVTQTLKIQAAREKLPARMKTARQEQGDGESLSMASSTSAADATRLCSLAGEACALEDLALLDVSGGNLAEGETFFSRLKNELHGRIIDSILQSVPDAARESLRREVAAQVAFPLQVKLAAHACAEEGRVDRFNFWIARQVCLRPDPQTCGMFCLCLLRTFGVVARLKADGQKFVVSCETIPDVPDFLARSVTLHAGGPDAHHTCYIELRLPAFEEAGLADVWDESLKLTDLLLLCGMLGYKKMDPGKEVVGQYKKELPLSIEDTEWLRVVLLELKLLGSVYTALAEQGKAPSSDEIHVL